MGTLSDMQTETSKTYFSTFDSPVGELLARLDDNGQLIGLHFVDGRHTPAKRAGWVRDDGAFDDLHAQLDAYFAGELLTFELPLTMHGSEFQRKVWQELREIPYGHTSSYVQIAEAVGSPRASRAVGGANGRNPISIVVPCHRVIGASGTLTGYGGGLDRKQWLLALESERAGS
jgi:methylated-DNA-[protein]-cysteine S-methyltransferase